MMTVSYNKGANRAYGLDSFEIESILCRNKLVSLKIQRVCGMNHIDILILLHINEIETNVHIFATD